MLDAGLAIDKVSKFAGHASIAITVDRYGHLLPAGENWSSLAFVDTWMPCRLMRLKGCSVMSINRGGKRGYPPEFRAQAVELYRSSGLPFARVAADLGVSVASLKIWSAG
jgi:Transposase